MKALQILRNADIYLKTTEVASMVGMSKRWVSLNKTKFKVRRLNDKKNLLFELSSVLEVALELEETKPNRISKSLTVPSGTMKIVA
tara:strand:- start:1175 stop:1432 length:258 start_codon:yes stop_codon:yes gene_type:complete